MHSKIIEETKNALVAVCQKMTPEERLQAFFKHSQLVYQFYQTNKHHRIKLSKKRSSFSQPIDQTVRESSPQDVNQPQRISSLKSQI